MPHGVLSVVKSGEDSEFEWKISNFSLSKDCYWSPYFKFEGEYWELELFPNGADGYMHLCLWRSSEGLSRFSRSVTPIDVVLSVSVKTTNGMKNFERREIYKGYGIYIKQWINRREFSNRQGEFLSSGCLTILLTMRKAQYEIETPTVSSGAACSCCKENIDGDKISFHKDCVDKASKCPRCDEAVSLLNWSAHVCPMANVPGATSSGVSSLVCDHGKILQDLKQLLLNQEHSDVILRVNGREFAAHKNILAVRSPVFASTFRHEMKENETGIVDIEDCDPSIFPDFLRFLYSNDTDNLSTENVFGLFTIADKYDCQELRVKCVNFIKENLTVETFCKALALAMLHSEAELLRVATDFFLKNANKILVTADWQTFTVENPLISNELFIKYVNSTMHSNS